jgi:FkbM family methyltransferase
LTDRSVEVVGPEVVGSFHVTGADVDYGVIGAIERAGGRYEIHVMDLLSALVRPDDVCLDVGANIGVLTIVLARLCRDGSVYAFEPGTSSYEYLARNVVAAGATNVTTEPLALSDVTGTLTLHMNATHPGGAHLGVPDAHEKTHETVRVSRLDDWVKEQGLDRIDVVKLDIEGAELLALDGATDVLERLRPTLVVECNPVALRRFQDAAADALVERLRSVYGTVYYVDGAVLERLRTPEQAAAALAQHGIIDLVCGPRADAIAPEPPVPTTTDRARATARRMIAHSEQLERAVAQVRRRARRRRMVTSYVHEPAYEARFSINRLVATHLTTMSIPVAIRNTSEFWYSSTFAEHPICASYHWLDENGVAIERDGIRTFLREPLGPGQATIVDLMVAMPERPGFYTLVFALVQEAFAWFDDLDPGLGIPLPVVIR